MIRSRGPLSRRRERIPVARKPEPVMWHGSRACAFGNVRGLRDGLRSESASRPGRTTSARRSAIWVGHEWWRGKRMGRRAGSPASDDFPAGYEVIRPSAADPRTAPCGSERTRASSRRLGIPLQAHGRGSEGLPRTQVRALLQDSRGVLWVLIHSGGLLPVEQTIRFVPPINRGRVPSRARPFYALPRTRMAPSGRVRIVLWKWSAGSWQKALTLRPGCLAPSIRSSTLGRDGTLWIGTRSRGTSIASSRRSIRHEARRKEGPLATGSVGRR
jgi:hypothetical protein